MKLKVYNQQGQETNESFELAEGVFSVECPTDLILQAVRVYLHNQRQGTANTKTRSEVSGGGRQPWRQKGTGHSRQGSIRSPLWKGGGVAHGPKSGATRLKFTEKMRKKAFLGVLSQKLSSDKLILMDRFDFDQGKTKKAHDFLKNLGIVESKVTFVLPNDNKNIALAAGNLSKVSLARVGVICTYDILNCEYLVFDRNSIVSLQNRCLGV